MADENKPVAGQPPPLAPVSPTPTTGQSQTPPAQSAGNSSKLAAKHGGNAGGRARADGLVPGSPEAIEADKKKDRDRKRAARIVAERTTQPDPLPPTSGAGKIVPVSFGPGGGDQLAPPAVVPWDASMLEPATILAVDVWEETHLASVEKKCMAANLPPALVKELSQDARFPTPAKKGVVASGGGAIAEGLNALGVSSKYKHFVTLSTSVGLILMNNAKLDRRLEELIKATKQNGQVK